MVEFDLDFQEAIHEVEAKVAKATASHWLAQVEAEEGAKETAVDWLFHCRGSGKKDE